MLTGPAPHQRTPPRPAWLLPHSFARATMTTPSNDWWDVPLPPPEAFTRLCDAAGAGVAARASGDASGGGRGLFATADAPRGATLFVERPALLVQDPSNRASVPSCAACHTLLPPPSPSPSSSPSPPATCACAWGCGERYCDERCRDEHALRGHRVLCVGPLDSWEHPIAALKLEAAQDEHGDGVLALVVEACARCLSAASSSPSSSSPSHSDPALDALVAENLHWFVRGAWWEHCGGGRRGEIRARCERYAVLVASALEAAARDPSRVDPNRSARATTTAERLASARGFGELASLAARNQVSVVVESTDSYPDRDPDSNSRGDDAAGSRAYDGAGLFPLTCLMNHGCEPNAEVRFEVGGAGIGPTARVVATRDVRAGEELRHAYVDVERSAQLRAADLAAFGFRCDCARCARERGA